MADIYGNQLSDEALVELCREKLPGDTRPFTALTRRYQQNVLATCFRMLGNRQDAEDAGQEIFLRVYRGLHSFEQRAQFSTWLYRITLNVCRSALSRRKRRPPLASAPIDTYENVLTTGETSEDRLLAQAEVLLLNRALQQLAPDEREVLILRETDGLSYREIADVLDIGLSAAKMRVLRARQSLQTITRTLSGKD